MSKIRNFFKKAFKKNKDLEESDEFYDDVDQEIEETDEELGEEVEFDLEDHEYVDNESDELDATREIPIPEAEALAKSELTEDVDDFADLTMPEDETIVGVQMTKLEENQTSKETTDEFADLTMPAEEIHNQTNPEDLEAFEDFSDDTHTEDQIPEISNDELSVLNKMADTEDQYEEEEDFDYTNIKIDRESVESEQQSEHHDVYNAEADLSENIEQESLSLGDRFSILKTKLSDKFGNFNKKDLNQVFKREDRTSITPQDKFQFDSSSIKDKFSNINWANIPQAFFSKALRNDFHRYYKTAAVITSVVLTASIIGNFFNLSKDYENLSRRNLISLGEPNNLTKDELNQMKAADVFKTEALKPVKADEPKKIDKNIVCTQASRPSSARVKLINTIVLQDSVKSLASIQEGSSSKLKSVRQGDTLLNQVKIDKIERLRLIVKNLNTGECESIESSKFKETKTKNSMAILSPKASAQYKKNLEKIDGIENDGNNFNIKKDFLQDKLSDISSILTQARGIQINNPDGTISFKVVDIEPGGVFAYLGVQDNDIITHINGEPITELNQVMSLFGKIGNISNLNLTIKRGGEPVTQNYNIK
jgi:type II secretory pathway component PulC